MRSAPHVLVADDLPDVVYALRMLLKRAGMVVAEAPSPAAIAAAVEAMRRGARDYVQKPWDDARLLATLKAQVELRRAKRALERHGGRVVDAAKALGVSRSALYRRLQALGLKAEE